MSEWISVKDQMPDEHVDVMFYYNMHGNPMFKQESTIVKRDIVCGHYANGIWHICYLYMSLPLRDDRGIKITHWMPLPEMPE